MSADIILALVSGAFAGVLALAGAVRARRSIPRWAFVAGMLALSADRVLSALSSAAAAAEVFVSWQVWRLIASAVLPGLWLVFSLTYARGNAGEFMRRWRWRIAGAFVLPPFLLWIATRFESWPIEVVLGRNESYLIHFATWGTAFHLAQLLITILILVNLERTYRAAIGTVRWRIKFMLLGLATLFAVRAYTTSQALLFQRIDGSLQILNSAALLLSCLLVLRTLFRAGHFELDVYPSHSALQGSVTILLAGVYLLIVGVLAKFVSYLGGNSSFTVKSLIVLVTVVLLAVLLQSDQVQLYIRQLISRHLQRPLHDYRAVWRKFTEGAASQVEQGEFCRANVKLVAEIFQTLSVTLWLVDDRSEELVLAASTSVSDTQARKLHPDRAESLAIIEYLRKHHDPVDVERIDEDWAGALRRCHPAEFHKSNARICVPVLAGGQVLALLMLSDRVRGLPFTLQDYDLLKSIGDQIGSGLLNVKLSEHLLQAREHEAFQTMATFFVHDLKNAASTLNLMLKNLPDHFDDPAFREDALRGVGKSVAHINHLISRLGQLRSELRIQPKEADLNAIIEKVLAGFDPGPDFQIERHLEPLPALNVDAEQFSKVVINLILNAREAMNGTGGHLRISTRRTGSWAVLTTADDGCGMTPDFLGKSLFRPFKTTKKSGLGIGMFQSKMIVEAHGGRITVESSLGHGTTFHVFLPLNRRAQPDEASLADR